MPMVHRKIQLPPDSFRKFLEGLNETGMPYCASLYQDASDVGTIHLELQIDGDAPVTTIELDVIHGTWKAFTVLPIGIKS